MVKGTTPTFVFTLPQTVDLSAASHVYVTFAKSNGNSLDKSGESLSVDGNVVSVFLTQKETLAFTNKIAVQINWTYQEGSVVKRACSQIKTIDFTNNLIPRVIE